MSKQHFGHLVRALLASALLVPALVHAQGGVVIQQHTTFNIAKLSSGDLTQTVSILGADRSRTVTTGKTKVLIISSDASSTEITRLDRDSVYRINDKKKEYTASSLADLRAELVKQQAEMAKQAPPEAKENPDVRYTVVVLEARATGEKQVINGFNTERAVVRLSIQMENTKTGEKGIAFFANAESWIGHEQAAAERAALAFSQAQIKALGIQPTVVANPYAKWLANVSGELAKISGYPIKTTITMELPKDSVVAAPKKDNLPPTSVQGAVLGAMFSKKKEPDPVGPNGGVIVFTSMNEVLSISLNAPAAADFEVPAGYKRKS